MPEPRRQERLATIITAHGLEVATRLLKEIGRGVTALEGTGMYTGEARDVLLCAVTGVQVSCLEEIVRQADPEAFVIVSPAEEVRGRGFRPFEPPS
ncbi:MAG TPA: YitT family protein [Anaerolineae bacterium]|nr:YitT family protein [Anaerolineae bacterium]